MSGVAQRRVRWDRLKSSPRPDDRRGEDRRRRQEGERRFQVFCVRKARHQSPQRFDRRPPGEVRPHGYDVGEDLGARGAERGAKPLRVRRIDEHVPPQELGDGLEGDAAGQFVQVVAQYDQAPVDPVHVRQGRFGRDHVVKSNHRRCSFDGWRWNQLLLSSILIIWINICLEPGWTERTAPRASG